MICISFYICLYAYVYTYLCVLRYKYIQIFVDKYILIYADESSGRTALHYASYCGQTAMIKLLLEKGADTGAKDMVTYIHIYICIYIRINMYIYTDIFISLQKYI
jgi:hypothetical protein